MGGKAPNDDAPNWPRIAGNEAGAGGVWLAVASGSGALVGGGCTGNAASATPSPPATAAD